MQQGNLKLYKSEPEGVRATKQETPRSPAKSTTCSTPLTHLITSVPCLFHTASPWGNDPACCLKQVAHQEVIATVKVDEFRDGHQERLATDCLYSVSQRQWHLHRPLRLLQMPLRRQNTLSQTRSTFFYMACVADLAGPVLTC